MTSTTTTCWFTGAAAKQQGDGLAMNRHIDSEACGLYMLTRTLAWQKDKNKTPGETAQGAINCARRCLELHRDNPVALPVWTPRTNAEELRQSFKSETRSSSDYEKVVCALEDYLEEPVDHSQKPIDLLQSFADRLVRDRAFAEFKPTLQDQVWARIVDSSEMAMIMRHLEGEQLIINPKERPGAFDETTIFNTPFKITVKGWESLRKKNAFPNTNKVFIATAFSWPEDDPVRSDAIGAIRRACKSLGYEADTVTQHHTDNITDRIMAEIRRSRFVITELTFHNRGAYYEAGYARGLGRRVFHIVRKGFDSHSASDDANGKRIHFDVQQVMYRVWSTPEDLEQQLKDWIEATEGRFT